MKKIIFNAKKQNSVAISTLKQERYIATRTQSQSPKIRLNDRNMFYLVEQQYIMVILASILTRLDGKSLFFQIFNHALLLFCDACML